MKHIMIVCFCSITLFGWTSDLQISDPLLFEEAGGAYALVDVQWNNAWSNAINNDAVWLFCKFSSEFARSKHIKVLPQGHKVQHIHSQKNTKIDIEVPSDQTGIFIYPSDDFRGDIHLTLRIDLEPEDVRTGKRNLAHFKVYGLEMVKIPGSAFWLGDLDTSLLKHGILYTSDADGQYDGLFKVESETQTIEIGPSDGKLYYQDPDGYKGDQTGTLSSSFPKGVAAFYIMKYEPTQGQYVDFLNTLTDNQSQNRANFTGKEYYSERGSIYIEHGVYKASRPLAVCNYMSWDDALAFADWAALRPMTELEFTKAARGSNRPTLGLDFPWGTNSKSIVQRRLNEDGEYEMLNGWSESKNNINNYAFFGTSYYGVMDLAGGLWERVITIGDEKGRAFRGTEGDGEISYYGFATNEDWPAGIQETGGFGFRGGGFYGYGRPYHEFNPFSPVSLRAYGGWSGGNRTNAYGARFIKKAALD